MTDRFRKAISKLTDDDLKEHPVFRPFDENWLFTTNTVTSAMVAPVRTRILADGIPAESYAAGANRLGRFGLDRNVNMPEATTNAWNKLYGVGHSQAWRHSDIKNRPYQAVREVFLSIIEKGNLK